MTKRKKTPHIVVIGGGTGIFNTLRGLKKRRCEITAIVTMADDGGSSGKLRDDYGVLPPGDIRQALVALSRSSKIWRDLFTFRYQNGGLKGHSFGNLFLSALEQITKGNFLSAIDCAAEILEIKGRVVPVTLTNTRLEAKLENGDLVKGEQRICGDHKPCRIVSVRLTPKPKANTAAIKAIEHADLIVVGPGSLFSSLLPNLIVPGVTAALKKSKAKKVFVCNAMTETHETGDYSLADFLAAFQKTLKTQIFDLILFNSAKPNIRRLKKYAQKHSTVVAKGMLPKTSPRLSELPLITERGYIRHDPKKIANAIFDLVP